MTLPTVTVETSCGCDPDTPLADVIWDDITDRWLGGTIRRGRTHELQRDDAGILNGRLDNRDRALDPTYTGSPFYPDIIPVMPFRVSVVWASIIYRLFTGYVEAWPQVYAGIGAAGEVAIRAVDGFKHLGLANVSGTFAQMRTGARIGAILDAVGWPTADRNLAVGQSDVAEVELEDVSALEHLHRVAAAESGRVFVAGDGRLTFRDRHHPFGQTSLFTFTEQHYVPDLTIDYDDEDIANLITVQRTGGEPQTAEDAASQALYRVRSLANELTDLPLADDHESADKAAWLLELRANPAFRFPPLEFDGLFDPATLWPQLLGRELGDRVTVQYQPRIGPVISRECFVEAIEHRIDLGVHRTRLDVSALGANYALGATWDLGTSALGVDTVPRY